MKTASSVCRFIAVIFAVGVTSTILSARVSETLLKNIAVDPHAFVTLNNLNGSIEVETWDQNEILIEAEKWAYDDADLDRISIELTVHDNNIRISSRHKSKLMWYLFLTEAYGGVRYKLTVPASLAQLDVKVLNGLIKASGLNCAVKFHTMNGSIQANSLGSDASLGTMNGSILANFATVHSNQNIRLQTMNGASVVKLPNDVSARVRANSLTGLVTCDLPIKLEKSGRHSLRGTIGQGGATIYLLSLNGGLAVKSN